MDIRGHVSIPFSRDGHCNLPSTISNTPKLRGFNSLFVGIVIALGLIMAKPATEARLFHFPFCWDGHCNKEALRAKATAHITFQFPFRWDGHCNLVYAIVLVPDVPEFQFPFRRDGHCNVLRVMPEEAEQK